MGAIILSVGDELVLGQTVDTNSAWLSRQLAAIGWPVMAHMTVADHQPDIEQAIREACQRAELVLVTGGLGPTADDLTRDALAAVLGTGQQPDPRWVAHLEEFFRQRKRPMPASNQVQALVPRGAELLWNDHGTAPGIKATVNLDQRSSDIYLMPGVPWEMMPMFEARVLPRLRGRGQAGVILSRTLHTFGMGESTIGQMLGPLMDRGRNPSVGTTVSGGVVSLRINARFPNVDQAQRQLEQTEAACRAILGDLVYGADDQTLADAVAELLRRHPVARQWAPAVCTAESCTGGLIATYLTDVPGSSDYFRQGWVTYTNESKVGELGVDRQTIETHGAVSEPTVIEMARHAVQRCGAPYALAVSGIAGPGGATTEKPVGMICIALASPAAQGELDVQARTFHFPGHRQLVRDRAAKMALTLLRYRLMDKPLPF
jgi:nicotinamide-nucleotide amidase